MKAHKSRQSASAYISGADSTSSLSLMSTLSGPGQGGGGSVSSSDKEISIRRRSSGGRVSPTTAAPGVQIEDIILVVLIMMGMYVDVSTDDHAAAICVRRAPMADILSEEELALIEKIDLLPLHYIALKEALTRLVGMEV